MAKKEVIASELHMEQPSDILNKVGEAVEHPGSQIEKLNGVEVTKDYLEEIKFLEEGVEVYFMPTDERFGAPFVYAYNNGNKMEVRKVGNDDYGRWCPLEQIPTGVNVIIKRKYLAVFAQAKTMNVKADYSEPVPGQEPVNRIKRSVALRHPFTVVSDTPKGHAWLQRVIAGQ
jgi:hypothetical protein